MTSYKFTSLSVEPIWWPSRLTWPWMLLPQCNIRLGRHTVFFMLSVPCKPKNMVFIYTKQWLNATSKPLGSVKKKYLLSKYFLNACCLGMSGRRAVACQGVATWRGGGWGGDIIMVLILTLRHILDHLHFSLRYKMKEIYQLFSVKLKEIFSLASICVEPRINTFTPSLLHWKLWWHLYFTLATEGVVCKDSKL